MADLDDKENLDEILILNFLADSANRTTGEYCHTRFLLHSRCISLIEAYDKTKKVDWSMRYKPDQPEPLESEQFLSAYKNYCCTLKNQGLKNETISSYSRIVRYFLQYCEK
jgi:hypothetical protein